MLNAIIDIVGTVFCYGLVLLLIVLVLFFLACCEREKNKEANKR